MAAGEATGAYAGSETGAPTPGEGLKNSVGGKTAWTITEGPWLRNAVGGGSDGTVSLQADQVPVKLSHSTMVLNHRGPLSLPVRPNPWGVGTRIGSELA